MLNSFIKDFSDYCKTLHYAGKSVKELSRYIGAFNDFINNEQLTEITQVQYNHLLCFVTSAPNNPTTVKMRVWTLKKFFGFLMVHGLIKDNIAARLKPPKIPKKETAFLTGAELMIIFDHLHNHLNRRFNLRDFVIISLMATLGLRKSTVVALDVEDIDLTFGRIFMREKGNQGKRPLLIPLVILNLSQEYIAHNRLTKGALFPTRKKKRMSPDYVNKIVSRLKESLLCEGHTFARNLHPHIFRHAAATQLNETGGIDLTRQVLGQRRFENTRKYIHLSPASYGTYMKRHPYFNKERCQL